MGQGITYKILTPSAIREEEPRGSYCKGGTFVLIQYTFLS